MNFLLEKLAMGLRVLLLSTPQNGVVIVPRSHSQSQFHYRRKVIRCEQQKDRKQKEKQSLLEALDFSQVRSGEDAELLDQARQATSSGERMSREQYGALRRKIGGTYKDFFKSFVDVEGEYVEEGWVDKTCKVCKKDTKGEARQVDKYGRYVHVACLEKSSSSNFFTRFFST